MDRKSTLKTKIEEADEIFQMINLDFKDQLDYEIEIGDLHNLSNLQKWLIYDKHEKKDADIVLKKNHSVLNALGWDGTRLDAIFPVRQILYTLFETIGQDKEDIKLLDGPEEVLDIIDGKKLYQELKLHHIGSPRAWINILKKELEQYCKNVNTIGNYMPCPDGKYNGVKGWRGKWHYNDRIDLLYSDLLEPKCKNANGMDIINAEQRKNWKEWFSANKDDLFLTEILDDNTRKILGKFGCIKKQEYTDEELRELPDYLRAVNELICHRNENINLKCAKAAQKIYIEYFDECLSMFEPGKVFMQVTSMEKGYIWVSPDVVNIFDQYFNILTLYKYFNEKPIEKEVGEKSWAGYYEYAYLPLYDCRSLDVIKHLDRLRDSAIYLAFKNRKLLR